MCSLRLDSNIKSKSSNNTYLNIIEIFNKLSRGEICVANFIPPVNGERQGNYLLAKM